MRSRLLALPAVTCALVLGAGAASASAQTTQTAGQSATSGQFAQSVASSLQRGATNNAMPIRILSPGSGGAVSQSNNSSADSEAVNTNATGQSAPQIQTASGGAGLGAIQAAGQDALNGQAAISGAGSTQTDPTNIAVPIRILSPGNDGALSQSNTSSARSRARNENTTTQSAPQTQTAGGAGALGAVQTAGQSADNRQGADSVASSVQTGATNIAVPIRILSPGSGGAVSQSNSSSADSEATNRNATRQSAPQTQTATDGTGLGAIQAVGQQALNGQVAVSGAEAIQTDPTNIAVPIRILSPGNDGALSQSNTSSADSRARNENTTTQSAPQTQAGTSGGLVDLAEQAAGQLARSLQGGSSQSVSQQIAPANLAGGGAATEGALSQTNDSSSRSGTTNYNDTAQMLAQLLHV